MFYKRIKERIDTDILIPIKNDVYDMAKRVREYDDSFFIVFNTRSEKYELHSLDNKGNTYCFNIPHLDARLMTQIRKSDIKTRGSKIWEEMDKHNEDLQKARERYHKNERKAMIADTRSLFAKASW